MMQMRVRMQLFITQLDLVMKVAVQHRSSLLLWMNIVVGSIPQGNLTGKNKQDISSRLEYYILQRVCGFEQIGNQYFSVAI
jgi:hypothetical protein